MNDLINAIRYDRILDFRDKHRSFDVLLVDDIQFIAGKERTQEEFFHTFNALYDSQKQIVLSSDALPREIPTLEERLRSRFEWGLTADIQAARPRDQDRHPSRRKPTPRTASSFPTTSPSSSRPRIKSNIRELEGSLIRLIAYASLTGRVRSTLAPRSRGAPRLCFRVRRSSSTSTPSRSSSPTTTGSRSPTSKRKQQRQVRRSCHAK